MRSPRRPGLARFAAFAITGLLMAVACVEAWVVLANAVGHFDATIGMDLHLYRDRAESWLHGDGFYRARQLAGPYLIEHGDALYPPIVLVLLVPFTQTADVFWWVVPLAVIAVSVVRARPVWWAWPVLAMILVYPRTWEVLVYGNPSMWTLAAIAAGCVWRWPAVLAVVKPTLAPLALLGVCDRRWWLAAGVTIAASLLFAPMWRDYILVLANAINPFGLDYLLGELPIAVLLIIALRIGGTTIRTRRDVKVVGLGT